MSETENSGMSETNSEMETQTAADIQAESMNAPAEMAQPVSNQEAMVAQTLSRVKKQSKQLDKVNKALAQLPSQFKDLDKKQSRQLKQIERQIKQMQSQIKQLQKQMARKNAGSNAKKKAGKKRKR